MKSRVHPKFKTKYRVGNWPEYETLWTIRDESPLRKVQAAAQLTLGQRDDFQGVGSYAVDGERALYEFDHLQIGMLARASGSSGTVGGHGASGTRA